MADKAVSELIEAERITATDLFVLEQNGTAKKLTGQILLNWLTAAADGHGGIQSISKLRTEGLADTYRITLADTTIFDFVVTNGRSVNRISKTSTSGLVDTYTIEYNDGTTGTFVVTNGEKGDKGDNTYVWIKYASTEPTEASHSFGSLPDDWIGIYFGPLEEAPADWREYAWYKIKGEQGDTGAPATLVSSSVTYQVGDSGSIIPSGAWSESVAVVPQGKYLWTRVVHQFNTGDPVTSYSVSRMGMDGAGSVSSVAGISPNADGNVPLKAEDVGAVPSIGGDLTGELKMNGQPISGLNAPTANDQAANMGFVNQQVKKAAPRNLLDNSDFMNPVNQRGETSYGGASGYTIDRWYISEGAKVTIDLHDKYISFAATAGASNFTQIIPVERVAGRTVTLAAKVSNPVNLKMVIGNNYSAIAGVNITESGIFVVTGRYPENITTPRVCFRAISESTDFSGNIEWAAVYEGEYTAETLPKYQPKGYSAELEACQRYFYRVSGGSSYLATGLFNNSTNMIVPFMLPTAMRTTPTISHSNVATYRSGTILKATAVSILRIANPDRPIIYVTVASGGVANEVAMLYFDGLGYIEFSADL